MRREKSSTIQVFDTRKYEIRCIKREKRGSIRYDARFMHVTFLITKAYKEEVLEFGVVETIRQRRVTHRSSIISNASIIMRRVCMPNA